MGHLLQSSHPAYILDGFAIASSGQETDASGNARQAKGFLSGPPFDPPLDCTSTHSAALLGHRATPGVHSL